MGFPITELLDYEAALLGYSNIFIQMVYSVLAAKKRYKRRASSNGLENVDW